jgi:hypothetical protein
MPTCGGAKATLANADAGHRARYQFSLVCKPTTTGTPFRRFQLRATMPRLEYIATRTPPMPERLLKVAEPWGIRNTKAEKAKYVETFSLILTLCLAQSPRPVTWWSKMCGQTLGGFTIARKNIGLFNLNHYELAIA